MGMGTSACYADVIDVKHVRKMAPGAYKNFRKVLREQKVDIWDFASQMNCNDCENDKILSAWNLLVNTFERVTMPDHKTEGLILGIGYHEKEDRNDEIDGIFFSVDNAYELTPAGKKFNKLFNRKFYTQWG